MQDTNDNIHPMSTYTILLEKCFVHLLCSLNNQNDIIF